MSKGLRRSCSAILCIFCMYGCAAMFLEKVCYFWYHSNQWICCGSSIAQGQEGMGRHSHQLILIVGCCMRSSLWCGELHYVTLIGTHCMAYCPTTVLLQFGRKQYVPRTQDLKHVNFECRESYDQELWDQFALCGDTSRSMIIEVGSFGRWTTLEYDVWFQR